MLILEHLIDIYMQIE